MFCLYCSVKQGKEEMSTPQQHRPKGNYYIHTIGKSAVSIGQLFVFSFLLAMTACNSHTYLTCRQ